MTGSFSVTQVRIAFECPRLFYLGTREGGKMSFFPPNSAGIGNAFHHLSEQFAVMARSDRHFASFFSASPESLDSNAIAGRIKDWFYQQAFYPYLEAEIAKKPSRATALQLLWQGLGSLIDRWTRLLVSNRKFCEADELAEKTFIAQELNIEHIFDLPNGTQQKVRGQLDSLVYDFTQHRLCVAEYKTYQSADPSSLLSQVALYGYLLKKQIGLPVDSALYCVLPDWKEINLSWEQLEDTLHQLIPAKLQQMQEWLSWKPSQLNPPPPTVQPDLLCDICSQKKKCKTFFSNTSADSRKITPQLQQKPKPRPKPKPLAESETPSTTAQKSGGAAATSAAADEMGRQLVDVLRAFKIDAEYLGAAVGLSFVRIKLKPKPGVKVASILKLSDDLRVQLGYSATPSIAPQAGYLSVDLPRSDRKTAEFETYIEPTVLPPTAPLKVALGVSLEGRLIEADLSDSNTCHFLVGGTTGSGKSEFLRALLLSAVRRHSPEHLRVILVDPKRVTFPEFEQMDWLYRPIVKDCERAIALMEDLVEEMEHRYRLFEAVGCSDLSSYVSSSQRQQQALPRLLCIFDEYADWMGEKVTKEALESSIKRLGAKARAAGIHLIVATQRPEAKVVTPLIRSNLPGRVALRTASAADSEIILGSKCVDAVNLLGKGDLLFQEGATMHRLQSLFARQISL